VVISTAVSLCVPGTAEWTYVPRLGGVTAEAETSRVAAGAEDEPVLGCGRAGRQVHRQHLLPVLQRQRVLNDRRDRGCGVVLGGLDGRRGHGGNGRRHGGGGLAEVALDPIEQRHLLRGNGKRRQDEGGGGCEAHDGEREVWSRETMAESFAG